MLKAGGGPAVFSRLVRLASFVKLEEGKELTWRGSGKGVSGRRNSQIKGLSATESQER